MAQLLSNRAAVISYGLLIGWEVPPAIDQFTAGSWWWDVCAPGLLRHHNLQATRLFCQHPVSPDLEGLPNLGDLPHLVLSFYLLTHWGWYEITYILQTTFSNVFSWMRMFAMASTLDMGGEMYLWGSVVIGSKPRSNSLINSLIIDPSASARRHHVSLRQHSIHFTGYKKSLFYGIKVKFALICISIAFGILNSFATLNALSFLVAWKAVSG